MCVISGTHVRDLRYTCASCVSVRVRVCVRVRVRACVRVRVRVRVRLRVLVRVRVIFGPKNV